MPDRPDPFDLPNEILAEIITVTWILPFRGNQRTLFRNASMLVNKRWSSIAKQVFRIHLDLTSYSKYTAAERYHHFRSIVCTTMILKLPCEGHCSKKTLSCIGLAATKNLHKSLPDAYISPSDFPVSKYPNLKTAIMEFNKVGYREKDELMWAWIRLLPAVVNTVVLQFTSYIQHTGSPPDSPNVHSFGVQTPWEAVHELRSIIPRSSLVAPGIKYLELHNTKGSEEMLAFLVDLFPNLERAISDGVPFDIWKLPRINAKERRETVLNILQDIEHRNKCAMLTFDDLCNQICQRGPTRGILLENNYDDYFSYPNQKYFYRPIPQEVVDDVAFSYGNLQMIWKEFYNRFGLDCRDMWMSRLKNGEVDYRDWEEAKKINMPKRIHKAVDKLFFYSIGTGQRHV